MFLNADKGRTFGQLFQTRGTYIGAGRTQAAKNITSGIVYRTTQRQLNGFAFRRAVFRHTAHVTRHRRLGAHAIEQHEFLAVLFDNGATALFVACQHAAKHHEIGAAAKSFRHIPRHGAAAVADDLATKTVRSIGTFDYGGELRIADAGLNAGGADRAWANPNFDNIGTGEDQLFTHFTGDHVPGDNGFLRPGFAGFRHELNEVFRVAVSNVDAHKVQLRILRKDLLRFFEIRIGRAGGNHHMLEDVCGGFLHKCLPLFSSVVLVYRGQNAKSGQCFRHAEGADSIHVSRNNRHTGPGLA